MCAILMLIASCGRQMPPNILFITADDLNTDLGTYGHDLVQSPHINRLAAQGMRFERAYCQYPVCSPSRSSFLTGLYPEQTGVLTNQGQFRERLPDVPTVPQWFKANGYFAARVGKIFHYGVPLQIGTDGMDDPESWSVTVNPRGIDREVHDRIHTLIPGQFGGTLSWLSVGNDADLHTDERATEAAIRIMEEHHPDKTGEPLFLAVGYYRPHTPFVAPDSFFAMYPVDQIQPRFEVPGDRDDIPVPALADRPLQRDLTLEQRQEIIQAYYASVSFLDAQVGRLMDALEAQGLASKTIIVFLSDHGYHLGHHGLWQKGDLFEGSVRVPLIISAPNVASTGGGTHALAELVDLYPTLVDLAGLPHPSHLVGKSLRPVLMNPGSHVRSSAFTVANSRAAWMHEAMHGRDVRGHTIRTHRYRFTEWNEGEEGMELYDHETDPMEIQNLADLAEYASLRDSLEQVLNFRRAASR